MSTKKSKSGNELRVRVSAAIIYLTVTVLCLAMIYYISNLRNTIEEQRHNISRNETILDLTNTLIQTVNEAQSNAQIYIATGYTKNIRLFNSKLNEIKTLNDSIGSYYELDTANKLILKDITVLMERKKKIITSISNQYDNFNPYNELYNILQNYKPEKKTKVIAVTTQDTIVKKAKKKKFFERVFSSDNAHDSIIVVTNTIYDTIDDSPDVDNSKLLSDIQLFSEKSRLEHIEKIKAIERQYQNFIKADQKITEEVSELLIMLHKQTLATVVEEIRKSELLISKNMNYSIYSGSGAMLCIFIFIILIFYDIQKVAKARKEREEALRRADEIMESRHKLLLSVSHDIKAPLSSIIGYIDLMKTEQLLPQESERLNSMKYSSEHILSLLSNLLEFSSLDQGKQMLRLSNFDIADLCEQLGNMFSPIAENKQLRFTFSNESESPLYIRSDSLKIKQILSNILSNAIKYTLEGEVCFTISTNENHLIFTVKDSGIGIPADKLNDIYKPFSKAGNNNGIAEGNGFGLYVVKGLVNLLGGEINVESEIGHGTKIKITIPMELVHNADTVKQEYSDIRPVKTDSTRNILIIDDDNSLLTVTSAMLAKLGHKTDICRSSVEFSKYIGLLENFDLILTDREMGAFSGVDVLKTIKDVKPSMQVIIMTARDEYNHQTAQSDGFDGYLKKPFRIKDLATLLHDEWEEETSKPCEFSDNFPGLCEMFDNDNNAIRNILMAFVESTSDNLVTLNDAINEHDFEKAQAVCHKMKPMFMQLEQSSAEYLIAMDSRRGADDEPMDEWEEKGIGFMNETDALMNMLSERYDISD